MKIFLYVLSGALSGILGGMGMGGGTLLIPLLSFLKVSQHTAQAINLLSFVPMSIVAIIIHIKNKLVDFKNLLYLIIPAIIFGVLGSFVAKQISGDVLRRAFGGFLMLLSGLVAFSAFKKIG